MRILASFLFAALLLSGCTCEKRIQRLQRTCPECFEVVEYDDTTIIPPRHLDTVLHLPSLLPGENITIRQNNLTLEINIDPDTNALISADLPADTIKIIRKVTIPTDAKKTVPHHPEPRAPGRLSLLCLGNNLHNKTQKEMTIPQGNTKEDVIARRKLITVKLSRLVGKEFPCPCIGAKVIVAKKSVSEIAMWAAFTELSTKAALDLPHQLKIASFFTATDPKPKQKANYNFIKMYILHGKIEKKTTKIMIGVRNSGKHLQYCITAQE